MYFKVKQIKINENFKKWFKKIEFKNMIKISFNLLKVFGNLYQCCKFVYVVKM